jgi:hypothetical protein
MLDDCNNVAQIKGQISLKQAEKLSFFNDTYIVTIARAAQNAATTASKALASSPLVPKRGKRIRQTLITSLIPNILPM